MSETSKPEDVVSVIGRELAAMQGAILALASVVARHGDTAAILEHLLAIRANAAKEPGSSHFTALLDKMIDVSRPAVH